MTARFLSFVFGSDDEAREMPESEEFRIKYNGPALDEHSIDVNDLAPALMALGDLIQEANTIANQDRATVKVKIKATAPGSFEIFIHGASEAGHEAVQLLNSPPVLALTSLLALLGFLQFDGASVMALIKWFKGKKPTKVSEINSEELEIETKSGSIRVGKIVWEMYKSRTIRKSVYGILKPIEKPGIEEVEFRDKQATISYVKKDEVGFYAPEGDQKELLAESPLRETFVNVVHMWFKGGNKWKFSEGIAEWTAEITDANFLNRLVKGEVSIRANDFLKVRVKQTQFIQGSDISSVYEIVEVIEVRQGGQQMSLI